MTFEEALVLLKQGYKVRRAGWNGKNQWIAVQYPQIHSRMTQTFLYLKNEQGGIVPWAASQGDIFAGDWESFEEPEVESHKR